MAKAPKQYKVTETKYGRFGGEPRTYEAIGTVAELVQYYSYTLECGASWQYEKGNKKINRTPKTIKSLVTNLYNAKNNSAADGYSGSSYDYEEV